jgi:hypothetical protein
MSRSYREHRKNWNPPRRITKQMTKCRSRAKEKEAIAKFLTGQIENVVIPRYQDCEDVWNWD